jgi:hypothetical protein
MATGRPVDGSARHAGALVVVAGCAAVAISLFLPVMRWQPSAAHPTAGSARVFGGDAFTLVDAGFPGSSLVVPSVVAVGVLAVAAWLMRLGRSTWRVQLFAFGAACYYPAWVLYVFARKWEDAVFPAEGAAMLVVAFAAMATGLALERRAHTESLLDDTAAGTAERSPTHI